VKRHSASHIARSVCSLVALAVIPGTHFYSQPSAFDLFKSDELSEVIVTTDIRNLIKNKFSEEEQPALLQIVNSPGDTSAYNVEIRCRGNIRKETCAFPSVRIQFSKKEFSYHKLKWVNVCDNTSDEEYLLKEYMVYELLNIVTDISFEARLVRMLYLDSGGKEKPMSTYAFVLENAEELAAEFGGRVHEPRVLKEEVLNPDQLAIFAFFQYMISNTDWAFGNLHNVEVITHPETNSVMPVAYDFDYSGFVNQSYAIPHETMPISHVTVRHNKCICIDESIAEKNAPAFP
jgi:hypothetical protein